MCESLWITICLLTTVFFGSRIRSRCQSQPVVAPACCLPGMLPSVRESASQAPATPSPRPVHESGSGVHSAGSGRRYVHMRIVAAQWRFVLIEYWRSWGPGVVRLSATGPGAESCG